MLTNSGPVAKLYLSIIDDVIESMKELFLDEGLEDRVLDDLRHLWETKVMQSKAMEDFRKNNINSSDFVLQLPANYPRADQNQEPPAPVMIPTSQSIHSLPVKTNTQTLATFSLPASLAYPVQIPAGVTLQTASGQLYKVNVPVVVTQAPVGHQPVSNVSQKVPERSEMPAPQPVAVAQNPVLVQEPEPPSAPPSFVTQTRTGLTLIQGKTLPQQPPEAELALGENEANSQPEPVNFCPSPCTQLLDYQISAEEAALAQKTQIGDIDEILKEVIEEEREKVERARKLAAGNQAGADLGLDLDYTYSQLSDIVQLDGAADNSDPEEDEDLPLEENDFLGLINAEAIRALKEENGSDSNSISSSSEDGVVDELVNAEEEEDPLNSGDDVVEQDIPDLFDTDNVIVCQYDKIHRSKNRWKFHLKDGVMSYGGRDYVFSKAIGEAEW
ncbi:TFIIA-alpha and beta-like factor [Cyprinodon tularosa]|uniref:TFIIA-alpha and beta-like factor n=1 Tax=Cyprinodon tularosa TaxID=77115 RepID=UPI0018E283D8|nr:TFIIA-alpha and beta-like factor [Cyprinodon tularosa]